MKSPLKFLFSYHQTYFDLGELTRTDEQGSILESLKPYMKTDAFSFTAGWNTNIWKIPLDASVGYTYKKVEQNLGDLSNGGFGKANNNLYDYGILFSIPISITNYLTVENNPFDFTIKPSFGYSVSNIGDEIKFPDNSSVDPSPRYLRMGISGTATLTYNSLWNLFEWKGGRSASDLLVVPRANNINSYNNQSSVSDKDDPIEYQSGFGDIDFFENVMKNKADELITVHSGIDLTILDFYSFRKGKRIDINGKTDLKTSGYGINSNGIFYLLFFLTNDEIFKNIPDFINVQYNSSKWDTDFYSPLRTTEFDAISITISNIHKLVSRLIQ